jgi:hypothetical protein
MPAVNGPTPGKPGALFILFVSAALLGETGYLVHKRLQAPAPIPAPVPAPAPAPAPVPAPVPAPLPPPVKPAAVAVISTADGGEPRHDPRPGSLLVLTSAGSLADAVHWSTTPPIVDVVQEDDKYILIVPDRQFTVTLLVIRNGIFAEDSKVFGTAPTPVVPKPVPPADPASADSAAFQIGRTYAAILPRAMADGYEAAAAKNDTGASILESQQVMTSAWRNSQTNPFTAVYNPEFSKILPEGYEPTAPTTRVAVSKFWRDMARGLREGNGK